MALRCDWAVMAVSPCTGAHARARRSRLLADGRRCTPTFARLPARPGGAPIRLERALAVAMGRPYAFPGHGWLSVDAADRPCKRASGERLRGHHRLSTPELLLGQGIELGHCGRVRLGLHMDDAIALRL